MNPSLLASESSCSLVAMLVFANTTSLHSGMLQILSSCLFHLGLCSESFSKCEMSSQHAWHTSPSDGTFNSLVSNLALSFFHVDGADICACFDSQRVHSLTSVTGVSWSVALLLFLSIPECCHHLSCCDVFYY